MACDIVIRYSPESPIEKGAFTLRREASIDRSDLDLLPLGMTITTDGDGTTILFREVKPDRVSVGRLGEVEALVKLEAPGGLNRVDMNPGTIVKFDEYPLDIFPRIREISHPSKI
jgi:hypothetical protein